MKQTISSPIRKLKLLLVLPLIAGVFYAFAAPEYKFIQAEELATNVTQSEKTVKGKVSDEKGKPLKSASVVILGKTIGTITDDNGNFVLKVTDDSPIMISYVGYESAKVNPDFEKEMKIILKGATISIRLDNQTQAAAKEEPIDLMKSNALIIIDGKETTKAEMDKINPEKIESVSVLKGESATKLYGEKGKDGVVLITLKKDPTTSQNLKVQTNTPLKFGDSENPASKPLIIIDGDVAKNQNADKIPPENIESISVLKGESATAVYGEKGKNGVILITMKKGDSGLKNEPIDIKVTGYGNDQKMNQPYSGVQIRSAGSSNNESKPLIVIDGVISENQDMSKIDPETIESINVLKNESSASKYGEKGKNGVLEITVKPKTGVFTVVEEMPEFPGGAEALKTFVYSSMKYPKIALESGIEGQVYVKFVVDKTGSITNAKISRGVDPSLDKEAKRIVESMPKWKPGLQNGEAVYVAYDLPISFTFPADYHPKSKEKLKSDINLKIGNINWVNNTIYRSDELDKVLGIKKGDRYSPEAIKGRISSEVSNLYLDNGYLFSNIQIAETPKRDGIIDLAFTIHEGNRGKIGTVAVKGNKNVSSVDILNEIKIKPGDLFSKTKIVQSVQALSKMGKFDPEKINPEVIPESKNAKSKFVNVNLIFNVVEK